MISTLKTDTTNLQACTQFVFQSAAHSAVFSERVENLRATKHLARRGTTRSAPHLHVKRREFLAECRE